MLSCKLESVYDNLVMGVTEYLLLVLVEIEWTDQDVGPIRKLKYRRISSGLERDKRPARDEHRRDHINKCLILSHQCCR